MANEYGRENLQALADRLRGIEPEAASAAREAGREISGRTGKLQDASDIKGPSPTPSIQQAQGDPAARHRHVLDGQQQDLVGRPAANQPSMEGQQ